MSWLKSPKWGLRLAGIWLVLTGVSTLAALSFAGLAYLSAILAIAAGVLIVLDR